MFPFDAKKDLYALYLRNMQEPALQTVLVSIETNDASSAEWIALPTLADVRDKAETIITADCAIDTTSERTRRNGQNTSSITTTEHEQMVRKRSLELKRALYNANATKRANVLRHLQSKIPDGCYLHKTKSHKFLNCGEVKLICDRLNCTEYLREAQAHPQLVTDAENTSQGGRSTQGNRSRNRNSTSTPSTQPPAPSTNSTAARRVTSRMDRQEQKLRRQKKQMKEMKKQQEEFLTVLRMQIAQNASNNPVRGVVPPIQNPFSALNFDDEDDDSSEHSNSSESSTSTDMDELVPTEVDDMGNTDTDNNNTTVNAYLPSILRKPQTKLTLAQAIQQCKNKFNKKVTFSSKPPTIIPTILYTKYVSTGVQFAECLVIDSGCNAHMSNTREAFDYLTPVDGNTGHPLIVQQGDGSYLNIEGYGQVTEKINDKVIRTMAYFVPDLGCSLFSVCQHARYQGCYFHAENNTCTLAFPNFILQPQMDPEIMVKITKCSSTDTLHFDEGSAPLSPDESITSTAKVANKRYLLDEFTPQQKEPFIKTVKFQLRTETARLPQQGTPNSIGFDIACDKPTKVPRGKTVKISTGLTCSIPMGLYGRIASRSSLALKGLNVQGGVINPDYRGEIMILIHNSTQNDDYFDCGQNVAQIIFEQAHVPLLIVSHTLDDTHRQEGGFESTNHRDHGKSTRKSKRHKVYTFGNTQFLVSKTKKSAPSVQRMGAPITEGVTAPHPAPPLDPCEINTNPNTPESDILYKPFPKDTPSLQTPTPQRITPAESVNRAVPKNIQMRKEDLLKSIGYIKPDRFLRNLNDLGKGTYQITGLNRNPVVNPGETASIRAAQCNTKPSKIPKNFGDIFHVDIGFGPCTAIGGVKYTLLIVDKATRYKFVYPLKSLTTSLLRNMKRFYSNCKTQPKLIRTDFDKKLLQGEVEDLIHSKGTDLEGAPPSRQHQNGLVERAWQSIVTMSRNWLTSSLLPSKYWYYAVK